MHPRVQFSFKANVVDASANDQEILDLGFTGKASALGIFSLGALRGNDTSSYVMILQHNVPDQFNVLACTSTEKTLNYSFTHIEDIQRLGEHLQELGVPSHVVEMWNKRVVANPVPVPTIPLAGPTLQSEAADVIAKAMGGKPANGAQNKPE